VRTPNFDVLNFISATGYCKSNVLVSCIGKLGEILGQWELQFRYPVYDRYQLLAFVNAIQGMIGIETQECLNHC